MSNANPSQDPADNDTLLGMLRLVLRKFLAQTDDMLPARVIAYDRDSNRANVQPMVQMVTTDGQRVSRAQVVSVPVLNLGGGGFVLSFPIAAGDLGWIKASDRDISLFLQTYTEGPPNTGRMHTFSDALFIPDVMTGWSVADADAVSLQSLDGAVSLSLNADTATLKAGSTTVELTEGSCAITAGGATLTLTGAALVSSVPVEAPDFVAGSITLTTHLHPENGGVGPTGPAIPGP